MGGRRRTAVLAVGFLFAGGAATTTFARAASATTVYVDAVHGNDANNGSSATQALRTLPRAQQAARAAKAGGSAVTVDLLPGTFHINTPLALGPADSGSSGAPITWQAADPAHPPVITAERDIATAGWSYNAALRLWSLPGVTNLATRDLWVDGHRAARVHSCVGSEPCGAHNSFNPAELSLTANGARTGPTPPDPTLADYVDAPTGRIRSLSQPADAELVYRYDGEVGRTGSPWAEPRCGIAAVAGASITMDPCFLIGREQNPGSSFRVDLPSEVENAGELFDAAAHGDQWYWNRATSTLYYQAEDGTAGFADKAEQRTPPTSVIAGGLDGTLVSLNGASNVTVSGLIFAYTTWTDPSGPGGMMDVQTGLPQVYCGPECTRPVLAPAAVTVTNAANVRVVGDRFVHLGAGAVELGTGVTSSTVSGSTFQDIGGTGVSVGDVTRPASSAPVESGDVVSSNTFTNSSDPGDPSWAVGAQYRSSPAIWAGYSYGLQVTANRICATAGANPCRLPNAGIATGWGFNTAPPAGSVGNNVILANTVVNTMQWLWDGGPIYSLGAQPGEVVRANVIQGAPQTPGAIYIDQGGTGTTVLDNVIEAVANRNDPFTAAGGPHDEPAAGVYVHTCSTGPVAVIDTFLDSTAGTAVVNSAGGCAAVAALTQRGVFRLPASAMPTYLTGSLLGAGASAPPPPLAATGLAAGATSQTLRWVASPGQSVTGYEVLQVDPVYGLVVVGASTGTSVTAADVTPGPAYVDFVYARDAAGNLSLPSNPVPIVAVGGA